MLASKMVGNQALDISQYDFDRNLLLPENKIALQHLLLGGSCVSGAPACLPDPSLRLDKAWLTSEVQAAAHSHTRVSQQEIPENTNSNTNT